MSYARFFDTDVYVFGSNKGFVCMSCVLAPMVNTVFTKGIESGLLGKIEPCKNCHGIGCVCCQMHGDRIVKTKQEMVEHLKLHVSHGHDVGDAIVLLEREIAEIALHEY